MTFFLSYIMGKRSRPAGIALVIAGLFSGIVLIVKYFVEVPFLIFAASFSGVIVAVLFSHGHEALVLQHHYEPVCGSHYYPDGDCPHGQ